MSFFYYIYILKPTIFLETKKKSKNEAKRNHQTECTAEQSFVQKNCKIKGLQIMSEWYYRNKQTHEKKNALKLILKNISP